MYQSIFKSTLIAFVVALGSAQAATPDEFVLEAGRGNKLKVLAMLAAGEPIDEWDQYQFTALTAALINGKSDMVNCLLNHGASANKPSGWQHGYDNNVSPLMWAVQYTERDGMMSTQALLNHGADINATDGHGNQALFYAMMGNTGPAKLLIDKGADVNHQNESGCRSLEVAYFLEKEDVAQLLRKHGAVCGNCYPDNHLIKQQCSSKFN